MLTSQILTTLAAVCSIVAAVPATIQVREDDVILYGNGRFSIMKRDKLTDELAQLRKSGVIPPMPTWLNTTLYHGLGIINGTKPAPVNPTKPAPGNSTKPAPSNPAKPPKTPRDLSLKKRKENTLIIPGAPNKFLGWDVLMSSVVSGAPTTISVSAGYSIANSISVGASSDFTLIKDFLSVSLKIDYTQSWTTTQTQTFSASVEKGKYGAFVTNPWTTRQSGNVFKGTIGQEGSLTYYQADSFDSKGYNDLSWVDGVISLCTGDKFPLPRCLGGGTL